MSANASCCHGNNTNPADDANPTASAPNDFDHAFTERTLG
jgi:hypothetical protein